MAWFISIVFVIACDGQAQASYWQTGVDPAPPYVAMGDTLAHFVGKTKQGGGH
jgi:hypothetical protein